MGLHTELYFRFTSSSTPDLFSNTSRITGKMLKVLREIVDSIFGKLLG